MLRSEQGMLDSDIETIVNKAKRIRGQIFRVFKNRDTKLMIPLFKALVHPVIEYFSVLTSHYKQNEISKLEEDQRHFTERINGLQGLDYRKRVKVLNFYSLERRRERYTIIYTLKIVEKLVTYLETKPITIKNQQDRRRGRSLVIQTIKARPGTASAIKENSVAVRSRRFFNFLSKGNSFDRN